jgi:hypothetical protein
MLIGHDETNFLNDTPYILSKVSISLLSLAFPTNLGLWGCREIFLEKVFGKGHFGNEVKGLSFVAKLQVNVWHSSKAVKSIKVFLRHNCGTVSLMT